MIRAAQLLAIGFAAALACSCTAPATPAPQAIRVDSAQALDALTGQLKPGDVVVLAKGTYADQHFVFAGRGTEDQPITFRADVPGECLLTGSSRLSIAGEHLVVAGLSFTDGALADPLEDGAAIVAFRAPEGAPSRNCTLRDTAIRRYSPDDPQRRYDWVALFGSGHTVERCAFAGQAHRGVTLVVRLQGEDPGQHTIRRNHFADRPEGDGNGYETIRIGTGDYRLVAAHVRVEQNLFEKCDGETEIISSKSCDNVFSANTFLHCRGTLTLRQGDRARVVDNVFIGGDLPGTGGLRVTGDGHVITGNFFAGTTGRGGWAVSLRAGVPGGRQGGYGQVTNTLIDANTFADNPGCLFAYDAGYKPDQGLALPEHVTIANTLIYLPDGAEPIVAQHTQPTGITWRNNLVVNADRTDALPEGFTPAPPTGEWTHRARPQPLTPRDVGPAWMN